MKIGRNDPCPCGSGQKYKKCCASKDDAARAAELAAQAATAMTPDGTDASTAGAAPADDHGSSDVKPPGTGHPKHQPTPKRQQPQAPAHAPRMPVRRKPV